VTIRDRDSMGQIRVAASQIVPIMEKLVAGRWDQIARECGLKNS
jgi:glycyl-tRNA synthetase (class II)